MADVLSSIELPAAATALKTFGAIVAVAVLGKVWSSIAATKAAAARKARLDAAPRNVVKLYQFARLPDVTNISPFCMTIECFLRLAKIPHEVVGVLDPSSVSPSGRLPYIELNGDGIADSDSILKRLAEVFPDKCAAAKASTMDLAVSHVARKMLLRCTRMHFMRWVWVDNADVPVNRIARLVPLPLFIARRFLMGNRASTISYLNKEGHGDLSDAEYRSQFLDEMIALETLLTDPSVTLTLEAKAAAYAVLEWLWVIQIKEDTVAAVEYLKQSKPLQRLLRDVEREAFPDLAQLCPDRIVPAFMQAA